MRTRTVTTLGRTPLSSGVSKDVFRLVAIICVLVANSVVMTLHCAATEICPIYRAEGLLSYKSLGPSGNILVEQDWHFKIMEGQTGEWKLAFATRFPNRALQFEVTEEISFDGTNIYSVMSSKDVFSMVGGKIQRFNQPNQTSAYSNGRICVGPYPFDESSAVGVLWLAFLSGRYLEASSNMMRFPNLTVSNARSDPAAFICNLTYALRRNNARPLLEKGEYRVNAAFAMGGLDEFPELDVPEAEESDARINHLLKIYREGRPESQVSARYALDEAVPVGAALVPTRFHCELHLMENPNYRGVFLEA